MSEPEHLLPQNRTPFEEAFSLSTDILKRNRPGVIDGEAFLYKRPVQHRLLDTVMATWALDVLGAYVEEQELLLDHGVGFYRSRGTHQAVRDGVDWVGYHSDVEIAPPRRQRWNTFQLLLHRVRESDFPDLERIHGIAQLAVAERSRFVRGFYGHDVRAAETSYKKTSASLIGEDSGVKVDSNPAKWSFGRVHDHEVTLNPWHLQSLGVWILPSDGPFTWESAIFPWELATFPWSTPVNTVRTGLMAALLARMGCYAEFLDEAGQTIGYRRARVIAQVVPDVAGPFFVGEDRYKPGLPLSDVVYVEVLTGFGDGAGQVAKSARLLFGARPLDQTKSGQLWVPPGEMFIPKMPVASRPVDIPFGLTVRERLRTLLRFT